MINKILDFLKKRPGLVFLLLILSWITFVNIKPDFYLMGWDNYSSYFNLKTNIFRTFFATWREYRGLGVPSDAEVTDVFRQVFYLIASFIFPENLLEQIYYLFTLWVGVLGFYFLSALISKRLFNDKENCVYREIFATTSSLFYLFNLNTLSVFYSPIIPFINRFYSLPILIYFFLKTFETDKNRKKYFFILMLLVIITSGINITPTVFVVTFFSFFILFLFELEFDFKKVFFYSILFLLLNSFWFLPFLRYTFRKSPIIPLARTFIEINESTLNQPKDNFSLYKQFVLFPSFFDIKFPALKGEKFQFSYPNLNDYEKKINKILLFSFPFFYFGGFFLIILKKKRKLLWLPFWIFIFLFLSTKQYGPLGFIYSFLDRNVPYFKIIFRIGDTKFHSYVSIAGSLLAGYFLSIIIKKILTLSFKKIKLFFIFTIMLFFCFYAYLFKTYFTGDLINFFVYVKIPNAYFQIAEKINNDSSNFRVLHLPFDNWHNYWRSFSWGYLGSAFFNYFIKHPYIDKTFEPASMENTYLHSKINSLITSFYRANKDEEKELLAYRILSLFTNVGIKYVLLDGTISSMVYPKNINYNARQSYVSAKAVMDYLYQKGLVKKTDYFVSLKELYEIYKKIYPIKKTGYLDNLPSGAKIELFELKKIRPKIFFSGKSIFVDSELENLLETDIDRFTDLTLIQDDKNNGVIFPFLQQNHQVNLSENKIFLRYPNIFSNDSNYQIKDDFFSYYYNNYYNTKESYIINLYGGIFDDSLVLDFYHQYYPNINNKKFEQYIGNLTFKFPKNINENLSFYRLSINEIFISLPQDIFYKKKYIGSFLISDKQIRIDLLKKRESKDISVENIRNFTSSLKCSIKKNKGYLLIDFCNEPIFVDYVTAFNESTSNQNFYLEPEIRLTGMVNDPKNDNFGNKFVHGYICFNQNDSRDCLNLHRNLLVNVKTTYNEGVIVSNQLPFFIKIGLIASSDFMQALAIEKISLNFFENVEEQKLDFSPIKRMESIKIKDQLVISFPKVFSNNSFYFDKEKDFYDRSLDNCHSLDNKRITRLKDNFLVNTMTKEGCGSVFAQIFNYNYKSPYLLVYDYWVGSGQQPVINLKKKSDIYFMERTSLYQGYPNIEGMRGKEIVLKSASRFIEPRYYSESEVAKVEISFFQDTLNKGFFALGGINMIELPASWYSLMLKPKKDEDFFGNYFLPSSYSYKQLLPSLWILDINDFLNDENKMMLVFFNEGYDKDWQIYGNLFDLILGKTLNQTKKCDGYANCFLVKNNPQDKRYYIFYWPEKLYIFGWILTLLTLILSFRFFDKYSFKR